MLIAERKLKVLIACETSGGMREAFRALGHEAWSCDILDADDNSKYHLKGDALYFMGQEDWDLMVAHPPCTFLANSGAKHLYVDGKKENGRNEERWALMLDACEFFLKFKNSKIKKRVVENPIMHCHAAFRCGRPTQYVQPWYFGEPYFKATGLHIEGLPTVVATDKLVPPKHGTPEHKGWSFIHLASPGPDRWKVRSKSFEGICKAVAAQTAGRVSGY